MPPCGSISFLLGVTCLLAEFELVKQFGVTIDVGLGEVVEEAAPLADEDEKAAVGSGILTVALDVGGEFLDAGGQEGDLDLGGAGILLVLAELFDDGGSLVFVESHGLNSPFLYLASPMSNPEKEVLTKTGCRKDSSKRGGKLKALFSCTRIRRRVVFQTVFFTRR